MSPANPSLSEHDLDESVGTPEDAHEFDGGKPKPGRKKNPDTQAARRDQNRIAQREFRLRKQQKIRDLEARVELLSGDKEETYNQMRDIMRALMTENAQLRTLLKSVSGFIGDGTGGPLAQQLQGMGWQMENFHTFINKNETDSAVEAFNAIKSTRAANGKTDHASNTATAGAIGIPESSKSMDADSRKRRRVDAPSTSNAAANGVDFVGGLGGPGVPGPSSSAPGPNYAALMDNAIFGGPAPGPATNYVAPRTSTMSSDTSSAAGPSPVYQGSFASPMTSFLGAAPQRTVSGPSSSGSAQGLSVMAAPGNPAPDSLFAEEPGTVEDEAMMRRHEAARLFKYHLDNFRRNPSYCLPRSLNPTLVQRTVPHEQIIDGIPFPELRDRMILMKDRYLLPEVIHTLFLNYTIHGDDVLQHTNWEIHRPFLEKYPFLIDESTLAIANKWRRERGEADIAMSDILKE